MALEAALLIFLAAAVPAAVATDYTVGGSQGWNSGVDYSSWASGKTFNVGDTLLFQYSPLHSVAEVGESDFNACSASNSVQTHTDRSTRISLTAPGSRYFICGTSGHCSGGMKLAVTVAASGSSDDGSTAPSSPSSSSGTTTPTVTPTTPSSSSDDAPPSTIAGGSNGGIALDGGRWNAVWLCGLVVVGLDHDGLVYDETYYYI
ncbi:chemocyanin-like [Curcuma longa]|uniref:chemocyanin-like n=1 Tax=Curcuma longa TaxID=136217 RepID=UPI003D9F248F